MYARGHRSGLAARSIWDAAHENRACAQQITLARREISGKARLPRARA
jgi:hypothetical protein